MGANSVIEWTHHTFNPWWGCQRVSPGCEHCYAETMAKRWGHAIWGPAKTTPRRFFGNAHWQEPLKWNRDAGVAGVRRRVFCASMADVFETTANLEQLKARSRLWDLIRETPHLDWLLLSKRPENFRLMLPWHSKPYPNVWLGTSVEDQRAADERIPLLFQTPAAVRFLSCEPLLGPIDLAKAMPCGYYCDSEAGDWPQGHYDHPFLGPQANSGGISWIIAGGESGSNYRPMNPDWARSLRDQCQAAGVAFHFKQHGGRTHAAGGRLLDDRTWDEFPKARVNVGA